MEKRKSSKRSLLRKTLPYIGIFVVVLFTVIISLALMGPYIGSVYSNYGAYPHTTSTSGT
jgi:hypothetical protein